MLQYLVVVFVLFVWACPVDCQTTTKKLDYDIDPDYQNVFDSQQGAVPPATFDAAPETFVYGGIVSLSDSKGNPTFSGYEDALAMQCAISDINKIAAVRGPNTTFYYNIFNDQASAPVAMRAAVNLLTGGVPVTVGPSGSDSGAAVASLFAGFNYTVLSGSTTADVLSNEAVYGSYFRTIPSDASAAQAIGDVMIYFNWTLVCPVYSGDTYGLSGQRQFTSVAIEKNILVTCGRVLPPGQITGIQSTINCLSDSQASVVLLWMPEAQAADVIGAFYNSSLLPDITFVAPDSWGDVQDVQAFSRGMFDVSYLEGAISVLPKRGDQSAFLECVSEIRPEDEVVPFVVDYWEASLRCILSNDTGIDLCPKRIQDRSAYPDLKCRCNEEDQLGMLNYTHKVNYIYDAVFAVYNAFDQLNNNCTSLSETLGEDVCGLEELTTSDLQKIVSVSEFEGLTGIVAFNGNDPTSTIDCFVSLFSDCLRIDDAFEALNATIDSSNFYFKNGEIPISAIIPSEITFSETLGIVALVFIVIGLLISFSLSIYFYVNRNEKVIKKTSPFFSQLMLFGIILCICSQIFWDVSQSTWTCIVKIWLLAIGFGLIMGNLLAKTYRIFKIFNNARVTSLVIRDVDLLKFTAAIILLEIILLCLYTFTTGLPTPVVIQSTSDSLLKIVKCQVPSSFVQTGGTIWLLGVNFLLVLAAVIIAYLTRNVDSAFNESRYIAYTVYIYLLVTIILLPLYYTAGDSSSSNSRQFIIRTIAILVSMFFTLGALFAPKLYLVYKTKKGERKLAQASADKDQGRRIVDFGSTTAQGGPTTAYAEGSTVGGGAFSRAIRGMGGMTTTTSSGSENEPTTVMPGGPRMARSGSGGVSGTGSGSGTGTGTGTGTTSSRPTGVDSNEYSNLISSLAKRSK
ncbi:GPCR, family 3 domain-containing protein [Paramicrosporidium saccamoebae]|uniref:GPCR, family 3 domain-containing protein n=1 Tax=Paramicrosporidium saccamoebae TaxID=1246581 RepID=A0A2H9TL14_9FUNG|nr:GPCR, family 3 domain-containing protein [Paramicrosporidium saccamoebae]